MRPFPNTLTYTAPDYCTLPPGGTFGWTFNNQSAYQVQIDDDSGFVSPQVDDSGVVSSASNSYAPPVGRLQYNKIYYWRVKVWDSSGTASNWVYPPSSATPPGTSFRTPIHEYPTISGISWIPQTPSAGEIIAFAANTVCYVLGGGTTPCPQVGYAWSFPGGSPSTVTNDTTPQVTFALSGSVQAGLRITDAQGYTCPASGYFWVSLMVRLSLPGWREVPPQ